MDSKRRRLIEGEQQRLLDSFYATLDDDIILGNTFAGSDDKNESDGITSEDDASDVEIANVEHM